MNKTEIYIIVIGFTLLWLLPAIVLTVKVYKLKDFKVSYKKQLIAMVWSVPIIGNFLCYFLFAKIGKLKQLSNSEHRSIWVAARGR